MKKQVNGNAGGVRNELASSSDCLFDIEQNDVKPGTDYNLPESLQEGTGELTIYAGTKGIDEEINNAIRKAERLVMEGKIRNKIFYNDVSKAVGYQISPSTFDKPRLNDASLLLEPNTDGHTFKRGNAQNEQVSEVESPTFNVDVVLVTEQMHTIAIRSTDTPESAAAIFAAKHKLNNENFLQLSEYIREKVNKKEAVTSDTKHLPNENPNEYSFDSSSLYGCQHTSQETWVADQSRLLQALFDTLQSIQDASYIRNDDTNEKHGIMYEKIPVSDLPGEIAELLTAAFSYTKPKELVTRCRFLNLMEIVLEDFPSTKQGHLHSIKAFVECLSSVSMDARSVDKQGVNSGRFEAMLDSIIASPTIKPPKNATYIRSIDKKHIVKNHAASVQHPGAFIINKGLRRQSRARQSTIPKRYRSLSITIPPSPIGYDDINSPSSIGSFSPVMTPRDYENLNEIHL